MVNKPQEYPFLPEKATIVVEELNVDRIEIASSSK
jgi:hypothetical protein